jgi:hypothetical protein
MNTEYKWDIFLSHASEDKNDFVYPLAKKLISAKIKVWYDDFEIKWGDSIRESIDKGLIESRFAVVVLSKNFFKKNWAANEINAYFSLESKEAKRILPIWHNVTIEEVRNYSPILSDRKAADSKEGIDNIVEKIMRRLLINFEKSTRKIGITIKILDEKIDWDSLSRYTKYRFGNLGKDEFWQAAFLDDIQDNKNYKKIRDIDEAIDKANIAVSTYLKENPKYFTSGTDFITKSVGFIDDEFRKKHNWAPETIKAFNKFKPLIKTDY